MADLYRDHRNPTTAVRFRSGSRVSPYRQLHLNPAMPGPSRDAMFSDAVLQEHAPEQVSWGDFAYLSKRPGRERGTLHR